MKQELNKSPYVLKILNYTYGLITFSWLVICATLLYDTHKDQKLVFLTKNSIDLYQSSETLIGHKIGTINPTDHVKVLRVLYVNDHLVVHVIVNNHKDGWIIRTKEVDLI